MTGVVERMLGRSLGILVLGVGVSLAGPARADAVEDAYVAGNVAVQGGDLASARHHYERALSLLGAPNPTVLFNLGVVAAQSDALGEAVLAFERVLQEGSSAPQTLRRQAQENLEVVREQVGLRAAASQLVVDRPSNFLVRLLEGVGLSLLQLVSLATTWLFVLGVIGRRFVLRGVGPAVTVVSLSGLALASVTVSLCAGWFAARERDAPLAVMVETATEVHEGPGRHRAAAFRVVEGARVRVLQTRPGWTEVQLSQGLVGWVPSESVARLDRLRLSARRPLGAPTET